MLWIPYIQTLGRGTTICEISHRSSKKHNTNYHTLCTESFIKI